MGTRASYKFIEKSSKEDYYNEVCNVYFQYDGYPDGHPLDACEWMDKGRVVNGYNTTDDLIFNGVGCLAAQFIDKFKTGVGNVYLHPLKSWGECGEDYLYEVIVIDYKTIEFVGYRIGYDTNGFEEFFRGSPKQFLQWKSVEV
jgi:hypothetical protein